jgi:hypothetical protein
LPLSKPEEQIDFAAASSHWTPWPTLPPDTQRRHRPLTRKGKYPRRRTVVLAVLLVLASWFAYSGYDRYRWRPERIQQELLGRVITRDARLVRFSPNVTGYGDGSFFWEYDLDGPGEHSAGRLCREQIGRSCLLAVHRPDQDTELSISLTGNRLRVEEWWY